MNNNDTALNIQIPLAWRDQTLESFLRQNQGLSHSRIRALKNTDGIWLDGHPVCVTQRLCGGEQLRLEIATPNAQPWLHAEDLPLAILYEDQDLIVVDKPAGMVVHPVKKHQSGTLANALMYHWRERTGQPAASFHPLHRLDRPTSGTILIAKNAWAHQQLDRQMASGAVKRLYLAVCCGVPTPARAKITAPILSLVDTPKREIHPAGKAAATRYRTLQHWPAAALLAIKLYTGRTHQIRVHLAHINHPLWGDTLYGRPNPEFPRPALHAAQLSFRHPRTGAPLKFRAPFPADLLDLIRRME